MGLRIEASQLGRAPGEPTPRRLGFELSPAGSPLTLSWLAEGDEASKSKEVPQERAEALARLLLAPGERLGQRSAKKESSYPILGSDPPQSIVIAAPSDSVLRIRRDSAPRDSQTDTDNLPEVLILVVPIILGVLTVLWLFLRLLYRQRIDFVNGLFLAGLSLAVVALGAPARIGWRQILGPLVPAAFLGLWIVLVWASSESFLRAVRPGFTTSLDLLRARRLGPRGGRALLYGMGLGAALGGLRLALLSGASALPGVWLQELSLSIPMLVVSSPVSAGVLIASGVAIAMGLALRFLPERWAAWAPWIAALVAGLFTSPMPIDLRPAYVAALVQVVQAGFLVWVLRRLGLTTLLTAAVCSFLLPAAIFSGLHLSWLFLPFAVTGGLTVALLVLGWVGLSRPEQIEIEGRTAPAFLRRIEEERRLKYEMDLLARMQLGLLPAQVPEVPGWEISVRSLLATEAGGDLYDFLDDEEGGLWIAAGDVAGHGYSCSIAQAMTVSSLASLIHAGQTPPNVLQRVDRVLRRNGAHRHFTSLALMRLDPRTGTGRFANAGHPFPLLLADGEVSEIAAAGLPLGQGPRREYREIPVEIPPGGVLVFCSDGLFEGTDWQGIPYGYDRPRDLLETLGGKPAAEILEALFADWRRHLGAQEHQDDTTVVVIKRL